MWKNELILFFNDESVMWNFRHQNVQAHRVSKWVSEWVSEWASEWVSDWVSGRETIKFVHLHFLFFSNFLYWRLRFENSIRQVLLLKVIGYSQLDIDYSNCDY